jgi:hypothetical protein
MSELSSLAAFSNARKWRCCVVSSACSGGGGGDSSIVTNTVTGDVITLGDESIGILTGIFRQR